MGTSNLQVIESHEEPPVTIEVQQGRNNKYLITMPSSSYQDKGFLNLWLYGKSEKTQRAYLSDISKFYSFTKKSLQYITLQDVQDFARYLDEEIRSEKIKPSTKKRALATIKSSLSFGVKSGYLPVNVGLLVKLNKLENKLAERILSPREVDRMLFVSEGHQRNHAIIALLYGAALRCEELCNLTWRHVQERDTAGQIAVHGKGEKTRFVLLDEETWRELIALKPNGVALDEYVFQSRQQHSRTNKNDRRMDESTIRAIVREVAKAAGIKEKKVSPHFFRHSHASHALDNKAPINLVKETLGHESIETTAKYLHARPDDSSSRYLRRGK